MTDHIDDFDQQNLVNRYRNHLDDIREQQVTTIGNLSLNDIGSTRLRIEHRGSTVEGVLTSLDIDVEVTDTRSMQGGQIVEAGHFRVTANVTLGVIHISGLTRSHPCEVTD